MDYLEIIKALTMIHDICDDNVCGSCPFSVADAQCGITFSEPDEWDIYSFDTWRALL